MAKQFGFGQFRTMAPLMRLVLAAPILLMPACNGKGSGTAQGSILVVVLVDSTDSARKHSAEWTKSFEMLLTTYLPDDAQITLVRCDHKPEIGISKRVRGTKAQREAILKELKQMWQPRACGTNAAGEQTFCGSDVVGALDLAIRYAIKPENQHYQRKLIIGWTDLIADPCRRDPKNPIRYREPTEYQPPDEAKTLELILHGVPVSRHNILHQKWDPYFKQVRLYGPGEEVNIEQHYDLKETETFL